jgi:hypothetical protein
MINFYSNLKDDSKAEALRKAQLALLKEGFGPFYWAGFEMVGDPDGRLFGEASICSKRTGPNRQGVVRTRKLPL